jgi:hypothetical protein
MLLVLRRCHSQLSFSSHCAELLTDQRASSSCVLRPPCNAACHPTRHPARQAHAAPARCCRVLHPLVAPGDLAFWLLALCWHQAASCAAWQTLFGNPVPICTVGERSGKPWSATWPFEKALADQAHHTAACHGRVIRGCRCLGPPRSGCAACLEALRPAARCARACTASICMQLQSAVQGWHIGGRSGRHLVSPVTCSRQPSKPECHVNFCYWSSLVLHVVRSFAMVQAVLACTRSLSRALVSRFSKQEDFAVRR